MLQIVMVHRVAPELLIEYVLLLEDFDAFLVKGGVFAKPVNVVEAEPDFLALYVLRLHEVENVRN